jgi:hypothetical protein
MPGHVIYYVALVCGACMGWYALVALARRGRLVALHARLDPYVSTINVWLRQAPATSVYLAIITVTSVLQQNTAGGHVASAIAANSTNIRGMVEGPVRVLFGSAFLVADLSMGYLLYVLAFVLVTARLEHRVGPARVIVIATASHVLATLVADGFIWAGIRAGWLPATTLVASDVGVSYVLLGTMAGYLLLARSGGRTALAVLLLAILVGAPAVAGPSVWDIGHAAAAATGLTITAVTLRTGNLRPPLSLRSLIRAPARPLQP